MDLGGIGPPPPQCECGVLPLNYRPREHRIYYSSVCVYNFLDQVGMPRIELGLQDPQPCVLPLYDIPSFIVMLFVGVPGEDANTWSICKTFRDILEATPNEISERYTASVRGRPGLHAPVNRRVRHSFYRRPCRGAGNRTRSTRTRSVRTTGILHPDRTFEAGVRTTGCAP